ncbi:hypothetical protein [Burkholderia gladioli]|uniref:hypothetical protein n=1 Tax=Burkholderia gladioli TaxID=28095 RepID=UPI00163E2A50|nr:hypothetical protein [Burkholderia gladioli]
MKTAQKGALIELASAGKARRKENADRSAIGSSRPGTATASPMSTFANAFEE